jgi:uncharacterized phage protein gp47/JayE
MPLNITTSVDEINNRSKTDVQASLIGSNPFLAASFLSAIITANSGRFSEIYKQQQQILPELFPNTATAIYLPMWGAWRNVNQNAATQSLGSITVTGSDGEIIPNGETLVYSTGALYSSTEQRTIVLHTLSVTSISRVGTTATVITAGDHGFASGISVTIAGADQAEYNLTARIIVTASNIFTYTVSSSAVTPATGTLTTYAYCVTVPVQSVGFGSSNNLESGSSMVFQSLLSGVDNTAYVQFDGITGGEDIEGIPDYHDRVKESYANPNTPFNPAEITRLCKTVNGVTRVFVYPITPGLGQVTVYFVRDNDSNIIPSGEDVDNVKDTLLTILPADMADYNLFVLAPDPKIVNVTFTSLTPDTTTMRSAIQDNLEQAFKEGTSVGVDAPEDIYECTIYNTIDPSTGQRVSSFSLSEPIGDISIAPGQIAVLGSINYV